jgi:hypothetical protein
MRGSIARSEVKKEFRNREAAPAAPPRAWAATGQPVHLDAAAEGKSGCAAASRLFHQAGHSVFEETVTTQ